MTVRSIAAAENILRRGFFSAVQTSSFPSDIVAQWNPELVEFARGLCFKLIYKIGDRNLATEASAN
jgi:hypothetical protein